MSAFMLRRAYVSFRAMVVSFRAMVGCQLLCYGGLMSAFMLWWANVSFRAMVGKCQLSCHGGLMSRDNCPHASKNIFFCLS